MKTPPETRKEVFVLKFEKAQQTAEIRERMRGGAGRALIRRLAPQDAMPGNCRLIAEITLEPGCSIGSHAHEGETEVFYFTAGRGRVNDDGTWVDVQPGDALVTGNATHAVENTGDAPLIFTAVIILH
jgi:mannose-6-phosphate isomerase-like protein (cupin superfamily)